MKIYWSAFLSLFLLLALAGCGAEQFGTTPQSTSNLSNPLQVYQQSSCSGHTLIKPAVDILYVVDNSQSNYWISSDVKTGIQNTIASISSQFDYRVIGTPLLKTTGGDQDYQVLAKDPTSLPASVPSTQVLASSSQFTFFTNIVSGQPEAGIRRVQEFITAHQSDGLFRQSAYLFVVLVSNGRDTEVEYPQNTQTAQNAAVFNTRKASLLTLKTYLQSQQLRLFSVTANTKCSPARTGYIASPLSYAAMSQALYNSHEFGYKASADHYDLCSKTNVSSVFADVNSSIQQIIVPHTYKYWPITSTDGTIDTQPGKIKVFKSSPNSAPVELTSGWTYTANPNFPVSIETRVDLITDMPIAGEPTSRKHLIQFSSGNYITYPDCVSVTTSSNLEYFGYVNIPKIPKLESVVIKINGAEVPASGWSFMAAEGQQNINIKVAHNGYPNTPPVMRQGYMLKLTSNYYYKSGDNVEVFYVPASN
jgi:hypothetical protein